MAASLGMKITIRRHLRNSVANWPLQLLQLMVSLMPELCNIWRTLQKKESASIHDYQHRISFVPPVLEKQKQIRITQIRMLFGGRCMGNFLQDLASNRFWTQASIDPLLWHQEGGQPLIGQPQFVLHQSIIDSLAPAMPLKAVFSGLRR